MTIDALTAPLAGRGMLVTGASSGIGRAIALAAARAGADVAITYRVNEQGAREVEREIRSLGRRAATFRLDLADDQSLGPLGPSARDALGHLDVWVNNAGADILTGAGASLTPSEKADQVLRVDLRGTMMASWQAAEILGAQENGGVIINMSWDHVTHGDGRTESADLREPSRAACSPSASALARSVAPRVRVNVLAPGWIETSFGAGANDKTAPRGRRVDAARAVGRARRCRGRRRVSRIAGRGVPDRPDDPGRWRRRDVKEATWQKKQKRKRTTRRRSPNACAICPAGIYEDKWIRRVYKTDGWPTTLMLVNAIGYLAEAAYHHPDLSVTWGRVVVKLSTHSAGGITDKDFALARKIEDVALWRPAAGERARGHAEQIRTERRSALIS